MVSIVLTKFDSFENGNIVDTEYGYIINEPKMDYTEIVKGYGDFRSLTKEINRDTIRDVLEAEHYTVYKEICRVGEFRFDGNILYV